MKKKIQELIGNVEIADNVDLFAKGFLDSFGMFIFLSKLEKEFQIHIENDDLIPQNFSTINAIVRMIEKYIKQSVSGSI